MKVKTLAIVGVGLIGASIGLAARRKELAEHILGAGRNPASLEQARNFGAIDEGLLDIPAAVCRAEIAVFCTPVDCIVAQVLSCAPSCAPGTLLTDAGSTKATLVRQLETQMPPGVAFVGSHPLAGSEKRGPEYGRADLFQNRLTIVTRTPHTDPAAVERAVAFWRTLGSQVRLMDPNEHDRALALTSHLPHLAAAALAGLLPPALTDLTATGFRDTTRVAAGDPQLWSAIFAENQGPVLDALALLLDRLGAFRDALAKGDRKTVNDLLAQAKKVRNALGN
jgi:prephenate dehydrogenase